MPDQPAPEIELLRAAYAAFNACNIDAALALMTVDVTWPKAFKGGFVRGPEEIRAYWTEQWSEINPHVEPVAFHPEDAGKVLVDVHQVVRDLAGAVIADEKLTVLNLFDQVEQVAAFPLDEDYVVDLHLGRIDRRYGHKLPALDTAPHGAAEGAYLCLLAF